MLLLIRYAFRLCGYLRHYCPVGGILVCCDKLPVVTEQHCLRMPKDFRGYARTMFDEQMARRRVPKYVMRPFLYRRTLANLVEAAPTILLDWYLPFELEPGEASLVQWH